MAEIQFDDERLSALVAQAVKEMLAKEHAKLGDLSNAFLDGATKSQRELLKEIEDSRDRFDTRAKASLTSAEEAFATFNVSVAEKRKKLDDALNVKVIAGFSAFLLIGALVAASYLTDRIVTVNGKVREYTEAAAKLDEARKSLDQAVTNATSVYKQASTPGDTASQMQVLTALVTRIDGDAHKIDGDVKTLQKEVAPVVADYARSHSNNKKP
jgi:hypothetical protein